MSILASFCKSEAWGQTVLPDRSVLVGQKLVGNAKWDILVDFQTISEKIVKSIDCTIANGHF